MKLYYGGVFVQKHEIEGVESYEWVGGDHKIAWNATLDSQTVEGLGNLFKLHCPVNDAMNLRFYYMVAGNKYELDKDMEVEFAWTICHTGDMDFMSNIYCVSDMLINDSSHSVPEEHIGNQDAPPVVLIEDGISQEEVTSPKKLGVVSPRRSARLNEITLGSPSQNTRGVKTRKTPTKKIGKKRNTHLKSTKKTKFNGPRLEDYDVDLRTSKLYLIYLY